MKMLISEEMSKGPNTRRNVPSVVARLMGMDMLSFDTKSVARQDGKKNQKPGTNLHKKEQNKKGSGGHVHCNSNSSRQMEFNSFQHKKDKDPDSQHVHMKLKKPRSQNILKRRNYRSLRKNLKHVKQQGSGNAQRVMMLIQLYRLRGSSKQPGASSRNFAELLRCWRENPGNNIIAYLILFELYTILLSAFFRKKGFIVALAHGVHFKRLLDPILISVGSQELGNSSCWKEYSYEVKHEWCKNTYPTEASMKMLISEEMSKGPNTRRNVPSVVARLMGMDMLSLDTKSVARQDGKKNQKPGTNLHKKEQNKKGSGGHIEFNSFQHNKDKDPDSQHVQGEIRRGTMVRRGGIENPYSENLSDPKQLAQRIAKQVRESVTRDLGMNLPRSESTRSYRSEIQYDEPGSPEFINKDTRRLLAERLRNVLKGETNLHIPTVACGSSNSSMLDNRRGRLEQSVGDLKAGGKLNCWDIVEDEPEMQTRSFRQGNDGDAMHHRDLTPRSLMRSMSAPASSGTSFGKLLLEDRHILTGAQIRRKHEVVERVTEDVRKRKKERSNLKEKASSLKYNFSLRGSLFGRKILSAEEPHMYECDSMKDIMSGPTVMLNFGERHENFTEVPPSPAFVCSSVYEELWRAADHFSSTSTSDLCPLEDVLLPQVFREISSNPNELPRQLNELDADGPKETVTEEQPLETEMAELEDEAEAYEQGSSKETLGKKNSRGSLVEAYIRDLLVASGLYDGSSDNVLSRWDPLAKPITNDIFEAIEDSYKKMTKDNEGSRRDHKLLLDLLNEALSVVLGPPVTMSRFRKAIGPALLPPRGQKLLDRAWEIVHAHLYPPTDKFHYCLDDMVAEDLGFTTWLGLMNDDIDAVGKEMESQITRYLIEEIVKDMQSHNGV
ncbi:hypothetical protein ACSBR1_016645 [Camellia fascicularis]